MKAPIVIDTQNDFITGVLGTKEAAAVLPNIKKKIDAYIAAGDKVILRKYKLNVRQTEEKLLYISMTMGKALRRSFCRTFPTAFSAPIRAAPGPGFRSQKKLSHCTKTQYPRQTTAAQCLRSTFP